MEIVGNDVGLGVVDGQEIPDHGLECAQGLRSLHVADVLAEKDPVTDAQGHDVLQMSSDRQDDGTGPIQNQRHGGQPSGASNRLGFALQQLQDTVIYMPLDGSIMEPGSCRQWRPAWSAPRHYPYRWAHR